MCAELGKASREEVDRRIRAALDGSDEWVLIGGPPCQAYSLVGRARRANDARFEEDEKHFLYREYLRILQVHAPPVFVMENVKGLLSSHHGGRPMFDRICSDLARPAKGLSYEIRSFVRSADIGGHRPDDFIIESERYGVPQTRHRVILLGVRADIAGRDSRLLADQPVVTARQVLSGLPKVRSRLSRMHDSHDEWLDVLAGAADSLRGWGLYGERKVVAAMKAAARDASQVVGTGARWLPNEMARRGVSGDTAALDAWLAVPSFRGVIQHETRRHMASDLQRYLFASCFAQVFGITPKLHMFPSDLLPEHVNAREASPGDTPFPDRFRVQCADMPSSTVVSHIAKDGHYYIHFDPSQCRSLTVREAARLQTFPDDYLFEGTRTQQYVQVGNAVPPYLARQMAAVVIDLVRPATAVATSSDAACLARRAA
jgi:DNA (cytosine-5)-methyltransferase 1